MFPVTAENINLRSIEVTLHLWMYACYVSLCIHWFCSLVWFKKGFTYEQELNKGHLLTRSLIVLSWPAVQLTGRKNPVTSSVTNSDGPVRQTRRRERQLFLDSICARWPSRPIQSVVTGRFSLRCCNINNHGFVIVILSSSCRWKLRSFRYFVIRWKPDNRSMVKSLTAGQ